MAHSGHMARIVRTIMLPSWVRHRTLAERAIRWYLPWSIQTYPGIRRGMLEILRNSVGWTAVRAWMVGRNRLPVWAAERLADAIEARAQTGLAIVGELRTYIAAREAEPRRLYGFCVVGRDGRDRRGYHGTEPPG